jgi:hypothetical protein
MKTQLDTDGHSLILPWTTANPEHRALGLGPDLWLQPMEMVKYTPFLSQMVKDARLHMWIATFIFRIINRCR